MFFRCFLSVHFFPTQQSEQRKTNQKFRVSENLWREKTKFWRKNQTSRFSVSKRHILHSIPQTMFALSAQSFAVSARCVRLISHPITSRRCPIFFFFRDWDPSSPRRGALSLPKFFGREGQKTRQKSRETRSRFFLRRKRELIFPTYILCRLKKISFRKTHRNHLSPRRNTVVNRKQTSKRASLKVRAEVRLVF